jgi:hypothetical protein
MIRGLSGSKGVAAFVVVFLCLNVVGALCLSWCLQMPAAHASAGDDSHLSEHCRMMKQQAEKANEDSSRIEAGEASCCMMPVALFAAPVEKRVELRPMIAALAALPSAEIEITAPAAAYHQTYSAPVYRPPPLDRRTERLLNCVIRI